MTTVVDGTPSFSKFQTKDQDRGQSPSPLETDVQQTVSPIVNDCANTVKQRETT